MITSAFVKKLTLPILFIGLLLALSAQASANSIQFSGLNQVNKSIDIYDINAIAAGGDGYVDTINSSELFYFTPGNSYNFEIRAENNTTFLSNPLSFGDFVFGDKGIIILYFIFLVFLLALFCGGAFLMFRGKK